MKTFILRLMIISNIVLGGFLICINFESTKTWTLVGLIALTIIITSLNFYLFSKMSKEKINKIMGVGFWNMLGINFNED